MHDSVMQWAPTVLTAQRCAGKAVIEVGSFNVNGSVRSIVEEHGPASYLGVDMASGPGVDLVADAVGLSERLGTFDVVISTEMLEHVVEWRPVVAELVGLLAPGGLLVVTTRSVGFPYHPYPIDTWRYSRDGMAAILTAAGLQDATVELDPEAPGVFATGARPQRSGPWPMPGLADRLPGDGVTAMTPEA